MTMGSTNLIHLYYYIINEVFRGFHRNTKSEITIIIKLNRITNS